MTYYTAGFPNPGTSAGIQLWLEIWEQSQDIPNNRTQIGYRLFLYKANSTGGPWDLSGNPGSAAINGVSIYGGGDTYDFRSPNNYAGATDSIVGTSYMWVDHEPSGAKTISFSASYDGDSTIGDASLSGSRVLPAIPRAPGAPTFDSITQVTPTSFRANFTAPTDVGGGPITSYTLEWDTSDTFPSPDGSSSGAASPLDATSLTPSVGYYARVKATNAYGDSPWSNVRTVNTAAAGAPHLGVIPKFDGSGFMIVCTPPFSVGSVSSYTIRRTITGPGGGTPVMINDIDGIYFDPLVLTPGQSVTYQAYATVSGVDTGYSDSRSVAYQALVQDAPFYPVFDGSNGTPAPFSAVQSTAWVGTTNQSASTLSGDVPTGWRTFGQGAGSSGAVGTISQIPKELALVLTSGSFDVMAIFGNVPSAAGMRVGSAVATIAEMMDVYGTIVYYGQATVMTTVNTTLACEIEWFTDDLSLISRSQGTVTAVTAGQIVELQATGQAPSNAVYAAVCIVDVNGGAGWAAESLRFVGALQLTASARYPTFDGSTPDDPYYDYQWRGDPNESPSIRVSLATSGSQNALTDPDEPVMPSPPAPPPVDDTAVLDDIVWRRYVALIPADQVSLWITAVPTLTLRTGGFEEREVRIRYWRNPDEIDPDLWTDDNAEMVSEQIVSYIPANASFFIDGVSERAWANLEADTTGADIPADHLLYGEGGGPATWPLLDCGMAYIMTLDVPTTSEEGNITPFLDLTDRIV